MKKPNSLLSIIVLLFLSCDIVLACTCAGTETPADAFKNSKAVFIGKVVEVRRPESDVVVPQGEREVRLRTNMFVEVRFKIERAWKGVDSDEVIVRTLSQNSACGYKFKNGKSYLVYAGGENIQLWTSICSRTRRSKDAQVDIKDIEANRIGETVSLYVAAKPNKSFEPTPR